MQHLEHISPDDVSCVIPFGGDPNYLKDSVRSAVSQGFREVIVVNDGQSRDRLRDIEAIETVKVIHLARNVGLPSARNVGIKTCKTLYLVLLDHDDLLCPGYLDAISSWVMKHQFRCASATLRYIGDDCRRVGLPLNKFPGQVLCSGFFCETRLIEEVGFFTDAIAAEDFLFFRAIMQVTPVTVCPTAGGLYRIHARSASSTRGKAHWALGKLIPLYDAGEITIAQANVIANEFADRGVVPPGLESALKGSRSATVRLLGRSAYACWLNRDFLKLARVGVRLLPYLPDLARVAQGKWSKPRVINQQNYPVSQ